VTTSGKLTFVLEEKEKEKKEVEKKNEKKIVFFVVFFMDSYFTIPVLFISSYRFKLLCGIVISFQPERLPVLFLVRQV